MGLDINVIYIMSGLAWAATVLVVGATRGRRVAIFIGVLLGIYTLIAVALAKFAGPLLPLYVYCLMAVYVNFILLIYQKMRPLTFRLLLGWPASWFMAGTLIAFPWAIAAGFGFHPSFVFMPYVVAAFGFADSFISRPQTVSITLAQDERGKLARARHVKGNDPRPLRIIQITDPHIGSFMSVDRLKQICERAVAANPDLILLTGDFLTTESNNDHSLLPRALAPLKDFAGRCFACLGNHDHESLDHVKNGLKLNGVRLLVDEMVRVETAAGPIEILGFDFHWTDRKAKLESTSSRYPRNDLTRIALLHHPGAFQDLPPRAADLVLSGHTHGGQLGLLWFGLNSTIVSALTRMPDHGLWSRGRDLLYVHRGTGHYGFPVRLGVPPEESVIELHRR